MLYDDSWLWLVIVGFIIAFILSFGLGANDVANAFGTSVGAKVLTIRQACILGTIFEILGAVLIGAKVSNTIRKGIVDPDLYSNGTEEIFMAGNVAALTGSCIWMMLATFFSLPVSGTHSIVGATLGFSLVVNGIKGINGVQLLLIVGSWFASPLMSGLVSAGLFKLIDIFVLSREEPLKNGFRMLPIFYAGTVAVNLFSIFYKGSELLHFNKIPLYGTFILTFGPAILVAIFVRFIIVPRQRQKIEEQIDDNICEKGGSISYKSTSVSDAFDQELEVKSYKGLTYDISKTTHNEKGVVNPALEVDDVVLAYDVKEKKDIKLGDLDGTMEATLTEDAKPVITIETDDNIMDDAERERENARSKVADKPETAVLFTFLQVLTAIFGSFVHGGNDVSNAIGPLVALWITATTGSSAQKAPVPIWVLVYGGVGISVGLWVWGRRVMKTLGEDLTKLTPSSGFCIEIGSALTVLVASNVGIPISTTHCKVGSVVCVGRVRSRESVDWKLFRNIVFAWCVTLPVAGGLSALCMLMFKAIMKF